MTGPRVFLLGLLAGALRVPAQALLGPDAVATLDQIAKIGAAATVLYGGYRLLLKPLSRWAFAKAQVAVEHLRAVRALPARIEEDDARHSEVIRTLGLVATRLEDGARVMSDQGEALSRQAAAIERIESALNLQAPDRRDAA